MCNDCKIVMLEDIIKHLEHDIEAYRGALGYPIKCYHDGRLMDGTFPINGIAEALTKNSIRDNYSGFNMHWD